MTWTALVLAISLRQAPRPPAVPAAAMDVAVSFCEALEKGDRKRAETHLATRPTPQKEARLGSIYDVILLDGAMIRELDRAIVQAGWKGYDHDIIPPSRCKKFFANNSKRWTLREDGSACFVASATQCELLLTRLKGKWRLATSKQEANLELATRSAAWTAVIQDVQRGTVKALDAVRKALREKGLANDSS